MAKFHVTRTDRCFHTLLLSGERDGTFSDTSSEWNVKARNAKEAEAKARAEGSNFRVDEILSVSVEPFDDWRRRMVACGRAA